MSKRVLAIYREPDEAANYARALEAAGLTPVLAPPESNPSLEGIDGLLLMGGGDIDPSLYGEARHEKTEPPDHALDRAEHSLLGQALSRDLPVLAICRGLQMLNVFRGGTLLQHIEPPERHRREGGDLSLPVHEVRIEPGTRLAGIAGQPTLPVNSRHHQAVKDLGRGLLVSATDPRDGLIEALEIPDRSFVLAVQWHPENQALSDPRQLRIFERFGAAMRG